MAANVEFETACFLQHGCTSIVSNSYIIIFLKPIHPSFKCVSVPKHEYRLPRISKQTCGRTQILIQQQTVFRM